METAASGGSALAIPMTGFSLGLTGDNDIMNAHNLGMVALNARMQHERNDDAELARRGLRQLDAPPTCAWAGLSILRPGPAQDHHGHRRQDGRHMMESNNIAVSSELMAILAVATDLKDLRDRIGKIIVAYDRRVTQ